MKLYDNWKVILKKAWSVRFMLLAAVASLVDTSIQAYLTGWLSAIPSILIGLLSSGAVIARLVAQKEIDG